MPRPCRASTKARRSSGVAQGRLGRVVARDLVAPRRAVRVLHHRHQLDVREPERRYVLAELVGEVAPAEALAPRPRVHLVDRHRRARADPSSGAAASASRRPPTRGACGRRSRRSPAAPRRGTRADRPSRRVTPSAPRTAQLVGMPVARVRGPRPPTRPTTPCGSSRSTSSLQEFQSPTTDTPRAFGAHTAKRTPPSVQWMRPEPLPEPLVPPFTEQVEVELAEDAGPGAHVTGSSSRSMPTIGIVAQSGRLRVSYRSSYTSFSSSKRPSRRSKPVRLDGSSRSSAVER